MSNLTLYYMPRTVAAAIAITLNEIHVHYERILIDFSTSQQRSDDYLKLNPKGRVPTLQTQIGKLTETTAILEYIAATHPNSNLVPSDPFKAAQMRSIMSYLASTVHVNHAHSIRGSRWADKQTSWDDMANKVPETMRESAAFIESHCLNGPFVMGNQLSLVDPYLFVVSTWLAGDGVDINDFPKLVAFQETMWARPSVTTAKADGII
ncbi:MAG: glutathione S-transferase family protein [Aestuariivita sp.]|nr:glutathione S-transferase family protein [Aestuariivita sp.]